MWSAKPTLMEKILSRLKKLLGRRRASDDETPSIIELLKCGMFLEGNFFHRHLIHRTVPRIHLDESNLESVKLKAGQGPLVYITVNLGQLEFHVFNHLHLKHNLPLAAFNNALRIRWWLPFAEIRKNYKVRLQFLASHKQFPDPLQSGLLPQLLQEGKSLLLSVDDTDPSYISSPTRDLLNTLLETQKYFDAPIFVVPEQLIWDKRPKREKASLYEALFGENERPGRFKKLILFFRHFRNRAVVRFGEPIALKEFLKNKEASAPLLFQQILSSLKIEKRALTGPPIRPREWFLERMMEDEPLSRTIYEIAKEKGKTVEPIKELAFKYAKEIAADISYARLEFVAAILDWIFRIWFDKLTVDPEGLVRLKKTLSRGPTILVPNHRSHLDAFLIGYICYQHDIVMPYVAGGINMAIWPFGGFIRKCGVFFMRRTFAGNPLYKAVFQTYLKVLIREGYLQNFFIEGGRSRTGKLKNPRLGMLSMYTQVLHEEAAADIHFLPISITYDRVLEQKTYLKEVEGAPKEKERTRDLFRLGKFFKRRSGNIYVHFDESISLKQLAGEIVEPDWEAKKRKISFELGQKICHAINRQVVVIPQSLAAAALLNTDQRGIPQERALKLFKEFFSYLKWKQLRMADSLRDDEEMAFLKATKQFENQGLLKAHQGLDETFFEIPWDRRLELDFFKNISIHYFVSLALWSNLLLASDKTKITLEELAEPYQYFKRLFQYEFKFSTRLPLRQHLDKLCCYLQEKKAIDVTNGEMEIRKEGRVLLKNLSQLITPFLEAYWLAWKTYLLRPTQPNDDKALLKAMLTHGKHQSMLGNVRHPEAISQAIFENAIDTFKELGLFAEESERSKKFEIALERLLEVSR